MEPDENTLYSYQYISTSSGGGYKLYVALEQTPPYYYEIGSLLGSLIAYTPPGSGGSSGGGYFTFRIQTTANNQPFSFRTDSANLTIVWGDETDNETFSGTGLASHTYVTAGTYDISLQGTATRISFYEGTPSLLRDILTPVSDGVSGITSAREMFRDTINFGILELTEQNFFDQTSINVTSMTDMFYNTPFNQPIGNWNVSNVLYMNYMFRNSQFNQDISNWNVSNVIDMTGMFYVSQFNQPIGAWNVSNVKYMGIMFYDSQFNQPIGNWNVSNVLDMRSMFYSSPFNQPLDNWGDKLSKVTDMSSMFQSTPFNQPIGTWNVSNVWQMQYMFQNTPFNQPIGAWNVSNVRNMWNMFFNTPFNQPIGDWNVSNVTNMQYMFYNTPFNQPIGTWNVSKVTSMHSMFRSSQFNQDISNWNVSNVTYMNYMLDNTPMSIDNYDALLIDWNNLSTLKSNVTFGVQGLEYCAGETARQSIINNYGWSFVGDSKYCPCFLSGTQITMADGSKKNIEDVAAGDYVLSYNLKENKYEKDRVVKTFKHNKEESSDYYLVINNILKVTPNHPIYVNGEWRRADSLKIGDNLFANKVTEIKKVYEKQETYNLEVEKNHNYFAEGFLAHNK